MINQSTFVLWKEEYEQEKAGNLNLKYHDNRYCMNTLKAEDRFSTPGVFDIVGEETKDFVKNSEPNVFVGPTANMADSHLLEQLHNKWNGEGAYKKPKSASIGFGINHNFGIVNYCIDDFIVKNRQGIPDDILAAMRTSKMKVLSDIFKADLSKAGMLFYEENNSNDARPEGIQSITDSCEFAIGDFIKLVAMSEMSTVKCLKMGPASVSEEGSIDESYIISQMKAMNLVHTAKLFKEGFTRSFLFSDFNELFHSLCKSIPKNATAKEISQKILSNANICEYTMGLHKLYLRQDTLEKLVLTKQSLKNSKAVSIQRIIKGRLTREEHAARKTQRQALAHYYPGPSELIGSRKTFGSKKTCFDKIPPLL